MILNFLCLLALIHEYSVTKAERQKGTENQPRLKNVNLNLILTLTCTYIMVGDHAMCQVVAWDGRCSWATPKSGWEIFPFNFNWGNSFNLEVVSSLVAHEGQTLLLILSFRAWWGQWKFIEWSESNTSRLSWWTIRDTEIFTRGLRCLLCKPQSCQM